MKDLTPNIPEVVAEVRELFERYERAHYTREGGRAGGRPLTLEREVESGFPISRTPETT